MPTHFCVLWPIKPTLAWEAKLAAGVLPPPEACVFCLAHEHLRALPFKLSLDKLTMLLTASACMAYCKSTLQLSHRQPSIKMSALPDASYS